MSQGFTKGTAGASITSAYILKTADSSLGNAQVLASLATGILKSTTTTGVLSIAAGTDLPSHNHAGSDINSGLITGTYGGTGVNNGASTIAIGGNLVLSGAYATTLTVTGSTTVTLPTSGTLVNTALTLTGGTGINTIGDLSTNRTISINQGFAPTWTAEHDFNPGTTPANAIDILIAQPGVAGTRNSHNLLLRGTSYDTAGHNADWQEYVAVTSNAAASTLHLQSRIDVSAFADRMTIDSAGNVVFAGNLTVQGSTTTLSSTTLTVADKNIQVNYGGTTSGAAGAGVDVLGDSNAVLGGVRYNSSTTSKFTIGTDGTQIEIADISSAQTLGSKRINKRIGTETSSATSTPTADTVDQWNVTALAVADAFAAPTGTPVDGQDLVIRIKDNATARALTWNAIYRASSDLALPSTTVISKTLYLGFRYNAADSKWDLLAKLENI